jgi:hypothetical protein
VGEGEERQSWAAANKKLTAALATAAAIVGLVTGVLTLRDQLFPGDDGRPQKRPAPPERGLTRATVGKLSDNVQLSRFEQLLGVAASKKRLQNDEWLVSTWESPDIAVNAFSDRDSEVVAYMQTSLGPGYAPLVKYLRGGIRLRASVFADIPDEPAGVAGVYPPNARFSYEEFYLGGGATAGKSVVLAASYAANADDRAAAELINLGDCLPLSIFETGRNCPPNRVKTLREGLHVTSMTVGEAAALEALAQDGALFFPDAATGS